MTEKLEIKRLTAANNDGWILENIINSRDSFMKVPITEKYKADYTAYLKRLLADPFCYVFCRFNNDMPTAFRIFIIDHDDPTVAYIHTTWSKKGETRKYNITGHEILEYALDTMRRLNVKTYYRIFPVTNEWQHSTHAFLDDPNLFVCEEEEFVKKGEMVKNPGVLRYLQDYSPALVDKLILKYTDINASDMPLPGKSNAARLKKIKAPPLG